MRLPPALRPDRGLLPFTTHRIELAPGHWSMGPEGDDPLKSLRTQIVLEHSGGLEGKRTIDLGCLEGGYAAAFARHGAAESIGIEARKLSYRRCKLVRRRLGIKGLRFKHADVRDIAAESDGTFDVVFAAGILYHLDDPFSFLESVARMTRARGIAVIDTHVAEENSRHAVENAVRSHAGKQYRGCHLFEYAPASTPEEVESSLWAAYGNPYSFWLGKDDLISFLGDLGFSTVTQIRTPLPYYCPLGCETECRVLLVAEK